MAGITPGRDLADRSERAGEAEPPGDDSRQLDRCGGDEPHALACVEVLLGQRASTRVDAFRHPLVVDLFAEADDLGDFAAGDEGERGLLDVPHPIGVLQPSDPVGHVLPAELQQLPGLEEVARGKPAGEVEDGRSHHHGVVHIEEGSRGRVGWRLGRGLGGRLERRGRGGFGIGSAGAVVSCPYRA